jgi:hypothetical protein
MIEVDNVDPKVTKWAEEFYCLSLSDHLTIMQLLSEDDPPLPDLFKRLTGKSALSKSRRKKSVSKSVLHTYDINEVVPLIVAVPLDAVKLDVYRAVESHVDTPGFSIKINYTLMDKTVFDHIFRDWTPGGASSQSGNWEDAMRGNGCFRRDVSLDFDNQKLQEWCDFARFNPTKGSGAAIQRRGNTVRILMRAQASIVASMKRALGRQVITTVCLWIATYGPTGFFHDAASKRAALENYEALRKSIKLKCSALFPAAFKGCTDLISVPMIVENVSSVPDAMEVDEFQLVSTEFESSALA